MLHRPGQWGEREQEQRRTPTAVYQYELLSRWGQCRTTYELGVANKLTGEPQERLLEVVVGLSRDVVVQEVLLAVEGDSLSLDFALLNIDLVAAENNRDVFTDTDEVTCEGRGQLFVARTVSSKGCNIRCQLGTFL